MPFDMPRHDWTKDEIRDIYEQPLDALVGQALAIKSANWADGQLQKSQLLSIKTGGCPEDCGYCSQSSHHQTGLDADKLMPLEEVVAAAKRAKEGGADRFCMGAGWRSLPSAARSPPRPGPTSGSATIRPPPCPRAARSAPATPRRRASAPCSVEAISWRRAWR